jgi:hypothetical protein
MGGGDRRLDPILRAVAQPGSPSLSPAGKPRTGRGQRVRVRGGSLVGWPVGAARIRVQGWIWVPGGGQGFEWKCGARWGGSDIRPSLHDVRAVRTGRYRLNRKVKRQGKRPGRIIAQPKRSKRRLVAMVFD